MVQNVGAGATAQASLTGDSGGRRRRSRAHRRRRTNAGAGAAAQANLTGDNGERRRRCDNATELTGDRSDGAGTPVQARQRPKTSLTGGGAGELTGHGAAATGALFFCSKLSDLP
jgi:hypothetical protein